MFSAANTAPGFSRLICLTLLDKHNGCKPDNGWASALSRFAARGKQQANAEHVLEEDLGGGHGVSSESIGVVGTIL